MILKLMNRLSNNMNGNRCIRAAAKKVHGMLRCERYMEHQSRKRCHVPTHSNMEEKVREVMAVEVVHVRRVGVNETEEAKVPPEEVVEEVVNMEELGKLDTLQVVYRVG